MSAKQVFDGSDGDATKAYYAKLNAIGPLGKVATAVFRAQKCSLRAKAYNKRAWKNDAYSRKQWSVDELEKILRLHQDELKINYGWKQDPNVLFDGGPSWVFYVDLPTGQVSFHCPNKGYGLTYSGEWDGIKGASTGRVLAFCDSVEQVAV